MFFSQRNFFAPRIFPLDDRSRGPRVIASVERSPRPRVSALAIACTVVLACNGKGAPIDPDPVDAGDTTCPVPAPTMCPDPPLRYADVSPIFTQRCVGCHYGAVGGPWPLLQYSHAADWNQVIRDMLTDCSMPPLDSGVTMLAEERGAILTWVLCGFLE